MAPGRYAVSLSHNGSWRQGVPALEVNGSGGAWIAGNSPLIRKDPSITLFTRSHEQRNSLHSTNGTWDLVAQIETVNLPEFDRVLREIREIKGVLNSETSLLLNAV